jgi:hypothetical protein
VSSDEQLSNRHDVAEIGLRIPDLAISSAPMDEARLKEVQVKYGLRIQIADQALRDREVRLKENASKFDRWANPLTVGLIVGALGLVGNFINGLWANVNQGKQLENQQVTEKIRLQNDLIKEAIKPPTEEERAKSLVFFATNRLIDLDPEVLKELIAKVGSDKPVPGSSSASGAPASVNQPDYNLALPPDDPSQTRAARRLLGVAVSEINKNVDEEDAAERIFQYWRSTSLNVTDVRTPWSAAFLSWLIRESGSKDLAVSATNIAIWNDAVARKLSFLPGEKTVLPGDIVIFTRRGSEKIDELRSGRMSYLPTGSGVVYSSDQEKFSSIEGNVGNAVRLRDHLLVDRIIGFIRLSD